MKKELKETVWMTGGMTLNDSKKHEAVFELHLHPPMGKPVALYFMVYKTRDDSLDIEESR
jgi:hypothetical protein